MDVHWQVYSSSYYRGDNNYCHNGNDYRDDGNDYCNSPRFIPESLHRELTPSFPPTICSSAASACWSLTSTAPNWTGGRPWSRTTA